MADPEHLDCLMAVLRACQIDRWNEWRQANPDVKPDLQDADLARADLRDAYFFGARHDGAALREARLDAANLRGACLAGAHIRLANVAGADLHGASLAGPGDGGAGIDAEPGESAMPGRANRGARSGFADGLPAW